MVPDAVIITSDEPYSDNWHTQILYAEFISRTRLVLFIDPPQKWNIARAWKQFDSYRKVSDSLFIVPTVNRFPSSFRVLNDAIMVRRSTKILKDIGANKIL